MLFSLTTLAYSTVVEGDIEEVFKRMSNIFNTVRKTGNKNSNNRVTLLSRR